MRLEGKAHLLFPAKCGTESWPWHLSEGTRERGRQGHPGCWDHIRSALMRSWPGSLMLGACPVWVNVPSRPLPASLFLFLAGAAPRLAVSGADGPPADEDGQPGPCAFAGNQVA